MTAYLEELQKSGAAPFENVSGEEGAKAICSIPAPPVSLGFDEKDAARLGLTLGKPVSIQPTDNGTPYFLFYLGESLRKLNL